MTVENPTLSDLVYEIEHEVSVIDETAAGYRRDEEQHVGTRREHRANGMARAYEVESDRLMAILAKYQVVTGVEDVLGSGQPYSPPGIVPFGAQGPKHRAPGWDVEELP